MDDSTLVSFENFICLCYHQSIQIVEILSKSMTLNRDSKGSFVPKADIFPSGIKHITNMHQANSWIIRILEETQNGYNKCLRVYFADFSRGGDATYVILEACVFVPNRACSSVVPFLCPTCPMMHTFFSNREAKEQSRSCKEYEALPSLAAGRETLYPAIHADVEVKSTSTSGPGPIAHSRRPGYRPDCTRSKSISKEGSFSPLLSGCVTRPRVNRKEEVKKSKVSRLLPLCGLQEDVAPLVVDKDFT
ncbi:hypothetical protein LXL04_026371 [Taraxacum kok-saghyz]